MHRFKIVPHCFLKWTEAKELANSVLSTTNESLARRSSSSSVFICPGFWNFKTITFLLASNIFTKPLPFRPAVREDLRGTSRQNRKPPDFSQESLIFQDFRSNWKIDNLTYNIQFHANKMIHGWLKIELCVETLGSSKRKIIDIPLKINATIMQPLINISLSRILLRFFLGPK